MRFSDPWYLALLLPIGLGLWVSFRHVHGMLRARKYFSFALRGLMLVAIVLALAGPEARRPNEGVCAIFVVDRSDSISDSDRRRQETFINEALSALGAKDEAAIVVVGRDARMDVSPSRLRQVNRILTVTDGSGTDIAAAIRLAGATFPDGKARRIVLLSDGNETQGDAIEAASVAATDGVQVDHVALGLQGRHSEATVVDAQLPSEVRLGQPFDIRVTADSTAEKTGLLALDRDGVTIKKIPVRLNEGSNALVVSDTLNEPGFHKYRATLLVNGDSDSRNNVGIGFVAVRGRPRLLLLQNRPGASVLASVLVQQDIAVESHGPEGLPARPEELQNYDAILFNDINASMATISQMKQIQAAVKNSGVGFGMIGGENSFLPGGYYGTPIADALPVDLNIRQRKTFPSTSVLIIVDCSGSMGMIEDGVEKIRLAAKGAEATVRMMSPIDRVGVVGSTDGIDFVAPMQVAKDKDAICAECQKLTVGGGGIYMRPSMEFGAERLLKEDSKVRHLIVLADGNDADEHEGCLEIARSLRASKITTSIVSIGDGKDVPFLKSLAAAGGGRFYLALRAGQLPAIFTQDAAIMSRSAIEEGVFLPRSAPGEEILRGIGPNSVPALFAYCLTDARPLARVGMRTAKDDPLLATWQYGLGTSLAFTSDAQARWAARWVPWEGFGTFWAQAVRAISRRSTLNEYQITTLHDGARGSVTVRAADPYGNPLNSLAAQVRVSTPSGETRELSLSQQAPGEYQAQFEASELGSYIVTVAEDVPGGGKRVKSSGFSLPYPPEYRRYRANRPLLERLSQATGGRALATAAEAMRPARNPGETITQLWPLFALLAALLLPLDVGARRVAVPIAEAWARCLTWWRDRRAASGATLPEPETVGRLHRAKERVPKGATTPPPPIAGPEQREVTPKPSPNTQSAADRLLEAKRKRQHPP